MATLNLFPAHVEFVDDKRRLTPEAYRALNTLQSRLGGSFGDQGVDTFGGVFGASDSVSTMLDVTMQPSSEAQISAPDVTQPVEAQVSEPMVFQPDSYGAVIQSITPGASPYAFTATREGVLSLLAGTVSVKTFTRAGTTISLNITDNIIPMQTGDVVTVTYTVAPTYKFIPR